MKSILVKQSKALTRMNLLMRTSRSILNLEIAFSLDEPIASEEITITEKFGPLA